MARDSVARSPIEYEVELWAPAFDNQLLHATLNTVNSLSEVSLRFTGILLSPTFVLDDSSTVTIEMLLLIAPHDFDDNYLDLI